MVTVKGGENNYLTLEKKCLPSLTATPLGSNYFTTASKLYLRVVSLHWCIYKDDIMAFIFLINSLKKSHKEEYK